MIYFYILRTQIQNYNPIKMIVLVYFKAEPNNTS